MPAFSRGWHPLSLWRSLLLRRSRTTFRSLIPPREALPRIALQATQLSASYYVFTTFVVSCYPSLGLSMCPTFDHGFSWLIVVPLYYWSPRSGTRSPDRGDLVISRKPTDPNVVVLKRVIGVAGDVIEVEPRRRSEGAAGAGSDRKWVAEEDGWTYGSKPRGGREVERYSDSEGRAMRRASGEGVWVKVPKGSVWLVGDNLSNSTDSREYGPVPLALLRGKVIARVWPERTWFTNPIRPIEAPLSPASTR